MQAFAANERTAHEPLPPHDGRALASSSPREPAGRRRHPPRGLREGCRIESSHFQGHARIGRLQHLHDTRLADDADRRELPPHHSLGFGRHLLRPSHVRSVRIPPGHGCSGSHVRLAHRPGGRGRMVSAVLERRSTARHRLRRLPRLGGRRGAGGLGMLGGKRELPPADPQSSRGRGEAWASGSGSGPRSPGVVATFRQRVRSRSGWPGKPRHAWTSRASTPTGPGSRWSATGRVRTTPVSARGRMSWRSPLRASAARRRRRMRTRRCSTRTFPDQAPNSTIVPIDPRSSTEAPVPPSLDWGGAPPPPPPRRLRRRTRRCRRSPARRSRARRSARRRAAGRARPPGSPTSGSDVTPPARTAPRSAEAPASSTRWASATSARGSV